MSGTSRDGYDEESSLDDVKSDLISDVESVHTTPESRGSSSAFSSPSLEEERSSVRALTELFCPAKMTGGSGASAQSGVLADILRKHRSSRGAYKGKITRAINVLLRNWQIH